MTDFDFRRPQPTGPASLAYGQAQAVAVPRPTPKRYNFGPRPTPKQSSRWWRRLQMLGLVLAVLCGGFVAQTLLLGLVLLAGYGIVAFIWRIPSRTTLSLALLLLAGISILLLVRPNPVLASNFATYAFVLLLIGVVTLGKESRLPKRIRRTRR